jgi:peptide/nickel transport system permease protein
MIRTGQLAAATTAAPPRAGTARLGRASENQWLSALGRIWRNPVGKVGIAILTVTIVVAVLAPVIAPYNPYQQIPGEELRLPSREHLFGTDELGRDIFSRMLFGARISLLVGLVSVLLGAVIGVSSGLIAGYWGGWPETVIMRLWDAVLAFPAILLGIAVTAVLGPGLLNAAIAVGIISMPQFARISRASILSEKQKDYVTAAHATGNTSLRIVVRQMLPNVTGAILIQITLAMAYAVLLEAGLSFLGLGAQPPEPSWGSILSQSRSVIRDNPWYGIFPGVALSLLLLGLNLFADATRDALDPRQKHLLGGK